MKKKNHETRVLEVVVLTSKCKLRIPSARITPFQTYLVSQVSPHCSYSFLLFFWKHLICNVVLEFEEKTLKFLLEINRKLSDLARIYEPEGSLINIEQLKSKDEFDELNEKLEDPSEKANLVIK